MRLYLSSYKFGNFTDELVKLVGSNKRVAVIGNSRDWSEDRERAEKGLQEQIQTLNSLGFSAENLDLKKYFSKKEALKKYLSQFGLVWVLGGNTFVLKRAYEQSGFDLIIKEILEKDEIVYGGYSAGVVILSPSMKGLEIVDDPNIVPEGYAPEFSWDGLGLVSYSIAVHYLSDHPESALVEKEVEYLEKNKIPYKTLRDGEVIIINGDKENLLKLS
jgi:dipeptidase E